MSKNVKIRGLIIIIATVLVSATIGFIAFSNSPAQRLKRQLDLGQKYLNALDYEKAVATFAKAIDIEPSNETAVEGIKEAYTKWYEIEKQENNYDRIKNILATWASDFPDNEPLKSMMNPTLAELAEMYEKSGDSDSAINMYDDMYKASGDENYMAQKEALEDTQNSLQELTAYSGLYDTIVEYYGSNDLNGEHSPLFRTIDERREVYSPLISSTEQYLSFLKEHNIPQLCDANNYEYSVVIGTDTFIPIVRIYEILEMFYRDTGEMEKYASMHKEHLEFIGSSLDDTETRRSLASGPFNFTQRPEVTVTTNEYGSPLTEKSDDYNYEAEYRYDQYGNSTYASYSWREPGQNGGFIQHWYTYTYTYDSGRLVRLQLEGGDDPYILPVTNGQTGVPYNQALEYHEKYGTPYPTTSSVQEYSYSGDTVTMTVSGIAGYTMDGATQTVTINYYDDESTFSIDKYGRKIE